MLISDIHYIICIRTVFKIAVHAIPYYISKHKGAVSSIAHNAFVVPMVAVYIIRIHLSRLFCNIFFESCSLFKNNSFLAIYLPVSE